VAVISVKQQLQRINELLEDGPRFSKLLRTLFASYAGADRRLQQHAAMGLTVSLGAQIGILEQIGTGVDVQQMFWRFDFSGTGELCESECAQLVKFILRKVRDTLSPPPGLRLCKLPQKDLTKEYKISKQLGQGGQGAVYLAEFRRACADGSRGIQRVVKFYAKADANAPLDDIKEEFLLLRKLDHPLIARVVDMFEDNAHVYVVSEPYFGGDLTALLAKARQNGVTPTVAWLGKIFQQVLQGVSYLHGQMVMHCDLKEPNVMIANDSAWHAPQIVIIDFGLAKDFSGTGPCGTPGYMPPEVWQYGLWVPRGDIFSLAVIFWSIFNGRQGGPFCCSDAPPFARIRVKTIQEQMDCSKIPPHLRELTVKMAKKDFRQRPSARNALDDPFFKGLEQYRTPISAEALDALGCATEKQGIRNLVAADLMSPENLGQLQHLNELFQRLDQDNNGSVNEAEARDAFRQLGYGQNQIDRLIAALLGEGGTVQYSDFMAKLLLAQRGVREEQLSAVFVEIDKDRSGMLDKREIASLLERPEVKRLMDGRSPEDIVRQMDRDSNGLVSFTEFREAMLGKLSKPETSFSWEVGDAARYYSESRHDWLPCRIQEIDSRTNAVMVNIRPGRWLQPQDQQERLVRGQHAARWHAGDQCHFYSRTRGAQVECKVQKVDAKTGAIAVDVMPGRWLPSWVCEPGKPAARLAGCPSGHALVRFKAPTGGWSCDVCGRQAKAGAAMWGCRPCNYDCCVECSRTSSRIAPVPASLGPVSTEAVLPLPLPCSSTSAPASDTEAETVQACRHSVKKCEDTSSDGATESWPAVVVKDHVATDDLQLSLLVGDMVEILEDDPSGWLGGHKQCNPDAVGWFPKFCVQLIQSSFAAAKRSVQTAPAVVGTPNAREKCEELGGDSPQFGRTASRGDEHPGSQGELASVRRELEEERARRNRAAEKLQTYVASFEVAKNTHRQELVTAEALLAQEREQRKTAEMEANRLRVELERHKSRTEAKSSPAAEAGRADEWLPVAVPTYAASPTVARAEESCAAATRGGRGLGPRVLAKIQALEALSGKAAATSSSSQRPGTAPANLIAMCQTGSRNLARSASQRASLASDVTVAPPCATAPCVPWAPTRELQPPLDLSLAAPETCATTSPCTPVLGLSPLPRRGGA
jgi:serine/threonine protein kinase